MSDPGMKRQNGYEWALLVAVTVGFYATAATLFAPRFETMDDVAMAMWNSGVCLSTEPSGHIIFSHQIFGGPVALLYALMPKVAWYGWSHLAVMFAADIAIGRVLLRAGGRWIGLLAYITFLLYAQIDAFVMMQFTKTAFYATLAGWLLLADSTSRQSPSRRQVWFACAFALLGSLVRFESFIFVGASIGPTLVFWWCKHIGVRTTLSRHGAHIALFAGLPLLVAGVTFATDRLGEWAHYYDYRLYRARALDFGEQFVYEPRTKAVFDEIGWTENHLIMFRQYSFYDGQVFGEDKLQHLLQAFPKQPSVNEALSKLRGYRQSLRAPVYFQTMCLTLLIGLAAWSFRIRIALALLWLGTLGVLFGILLALKWPPHRVTQPMLAAALVFTCWLTLQDITGTRRWLPKFAAITLAAASLLRIHSQWPALLAEGSRAREQTREAIAELTAMNDHEDRLHLVWANNFPYVETFLPFDEHNRIFERHHQLGSWGIYMPNSDRMRLRFGINNPYLALVDHPSMRLLSLPEGVAELRRFLQDSYHLTVLVEPVFEGQKIQTWRVRSAPPQAQARQP